MSMLALALMTPFIVKTNSTGYGPVEWSRTEKCEVFANQILMTRTYGRREVNYQFPFDSQDALEEMIMEASEEQIQLEDNYMCDGPSTTVKAKMHKDGVDHDVLLYSTGGCGSPKKIRRGPRTMALIDIASTFCPTTH